MIGELRLNIKGDLFKFLTDLTNDEYVHGRGKADLTFIENVSYELSTHVRAVRLCLSRV